ISLRVDGLLKSTPYALQLLVEDDEGHLVRGSVEQVMTTGALPRLAMSEVMASPPLPVPRSDGEYVEILNAGTTPADLSGAALEHLDVRSRRGLAGTGPLNVGARAPRVLDALEQGVAEQPCPATIDGPRSSGRKRRWAPARGRSSPS